LLATLLLLPLPATAQQNRRGADRSRDRGADSRGADRQSGQNRGENRSGDNRGSASRQSDQRNSENRERPSTGLGPIGLPPQNRVPAWEQKQTPWWEQQQKQAPWWERQGPPSWEQPKVPAWQTRNPARTLLDEQKERRQREANRRPSQGGHYRPGRNNGYIYVVPAYGYLPYNLPTVSETYVTPPPPVEVEVSRPVEPPPPPTPPIGVLRLEVEPRDLIQIFVDGVFIGTPDDVGEELGLSPGVRHIELRARGYKSVSFDTDIVQDRSVTYRATLERDPSVPPTEIVVKPQPKAGSTTMYVIPGCYLGNVAPTASTLRPGCDLAKLTKIVP
jgi:hypothetical protein